MSIFFLLFTKKNDPVICQVDLFAIDNRSICLLHFHLMMHTLFEPLTIFCQWWWWLALMFD